MSISLHRIPVDLTPVVYCSAIAEGSEVEWTFLWNKFLTGNVAAETEVILNALGCTKKSDLMKEYFKLILSDNIRLQDKHLALDSTMTYQQNCELLFEFVSENYDEMEKA